MPPDATAPPRRRLSKTERRQHFLDTAAEIVAEQGVPSLTMEGVAARAGVNKALGYRYFANRDDLLIALFERETARFDHEVATKTAGCTSLDQHLRVLLDVYLDTVESGAMVVTLEGARLGGGPFEKHRLARERQSVTYLAGLIRQYHDVPGRAATTAAAVLATGAHGLVGVWSATGWPRKQLADTFVAMALGAIGAIATD